MKTSLMVPGTNKLLTKADLPAGTKLLRMERRRNGTYWLTSVYQQVPVNMTKHLTMYKKIGNNLFAIKAPHKAPFQKLLESGRTLAQLTTKYGAPTSLGAVIRSELRTGESMGLVRASERQVIDYEQRVAKLEAWLVAATLRRKQQVQAKVDRKCRDALAVLKKHGRLPESVCS